MPGAVRVTVVLALLAGLGVIATIARTSSASVPAPAPGTAVVNVYVGGDRETATTISPLPDVTYGLFTSEPQNFDTFDGFTTDTPRFTCSSDGDGDCSFTVPIGPAGVPAGSRLWVAPIAGPPGSGTQWYANPVWQTAPLVGTPRDQTRHVFQTPALFAGFTYLSGAGGFISDPGTQTNPPHSTPEYTRRIASGGVWPLSRADPELSSGCGLKVALIVDLSSSMVGSVSDLKGAMDAFVDSLRGTPSQAALFTFSTDTPALNAGPNSPLMSVATTAEGNAFKAQYASWSDATANGYTNWDRAFAAAAAVNLNPNPAERFDLAVFLTDGNSTVYGPVSGPFVPFNSGYTRFREIGNAVASANLLKSSGGTISGPNLSGGTRILAVGVGSGLDAGADLNLRSVSGRTEYDGSNLQEADFFRVDDYTIVGQRLRELFLSACAPSVSVIKRIVPDGGTIADAYLPPDGWDFSASAPLDPGNVTVTPASGTTDVGSGGINFDLGFDISASPATIEIAEDPRTADGYSPLQVAGSNAVCFNKSDNDNPVPVTNIGTTGFRVDVGLLDAVSCIVYNEAPPAIPDPASIVVDKQWEITSATGTQTFDEGEQPPDLQSFLELTGPGAAGASDQPWGVERSGYSDGNLVTISEDLDLRLPGCSFEGASITGPGVSATLPSGSPSIAVLLDADENAYTITNEIECHSHLFLHKQVEGGGADPGSWELTAIEPPGALDGPSGTSGANGEVTENVTYQLAESLLDDDPGLLNYAQADDRSAPLANPDSTGSMDCNVIVPGGRTRSGSSTGEEGGVTVPLGQDVDCVATNATSSLSIVKNVSGGNAPPSFFSFEVRPINADPPGVPAYTVPGAADPGQTVDVRPGQAYSITENPPGGGYSLAGLSCGFGDTELEPQSLVLPAGAAAICTAVNVPQPNVPPPPPARPGQTPGSVSVTKRADHARARSGTRVRYTILVRSRGPGVARSVRVCDRLPGALVLVSRSRGGTLRGGQICWTIATLRPGARRTFRVTMRVPRLRARLTIVRNSVRVSGANIRSRTARARVRVRGAPSQARFTG